MRDGGVVIFIGREDMLKERATVTGKKGREDAMSFEREAMLTERPSEEVILRPSL